MCALFDTEPAGPTHDGPIAPPANEPVVLLESSGAQSTAASVSAAEDLSSTPAAIESTAFTVDKNATFEASSAEPVESLRDPVSRELGTVVAAEPVLDRVPGDPSRLDQIVEADDARRSSSSSNMTSTSDGSPASEAEGDGALEQHLDDVSSSILIVRNV